MSTTQDELRSRISQRIAEMQGGAVDKRSDEEISQSISDKLKARAVATVTDEVAAHQVGQGGLGPTLGHPMIRFALGAGDTFNEKRTALRKFMPEGDLFVARGEPYEADPLSPNDVPPIDVQRMVEPEAMLFRESQAHPWGRVNDPDKTEVGDFTEFFADDIGSLIGEIIAFKGAGMAIGLAKTMVRAGLGGLAGDQAQQLAESGLELNEEPWDVVLGRSFTKGAAAAVGTALAEPLVALGRLGKGKGIGMTEEGEAALVAADELGLDAADVGLTIGQVSANPALKRLESLSEQIIPSLKARKQNQQRFLAGKLDTLSNEQDRAAFMSRVSKAHGEMEETMLAEASRLTRPGVDFESAGVQLEQAYSQFERSSKQAVNSAYTEARAVAEPQFDLRVPVTDEGATIKDVVQEQLAQLKRAFAQQTEEGVTTGTANPLKDGGNAQKVVRLLSNIANMPDELVAVTTAPIKGGREFTVPPLEQLRGFRSDLFDLSAPEQPGLFSTSNRAAATVKGALDRLLDNPISGNTELYKTANTIAAGRYQTLEDTTIAALSKSMRPAEIAAMATTPMRGGNFRTLAMLRSISTPEQFSAVQGAYVNDLIKGARAGGDLVKQMDKLDDKSLDLLLSRRDQGFLRDIGGSINRSTTGPVAKALNRQSKYMAFIDDLAGEGSTRAIDDFARTIQSADAGTQRSVKAALWDWAAKDMITVGDMGVRKITPTSADATVKKIKRLGLDKFFPTVDEQAMLRNLPLIANFIKTTSDTGAAISGAQTVQAARNPFTPSGLVAWGHIVEAWSVGRLMTNPKARRFLVGNASRDIKGTTKNAMRFAAAYATTTVADLEEEGRTTTE